MYLKLSQKTKIIILSIISFLFILFILINFKNYYNQFLINCHFIETSSFIPEIPGDNIIDSTIKENTDILSIIKINLNNFKDNIFNFFKASDDTSFLEKISDLFLNSIINLIIFLADFSIWISWISNIIILLIVLIYVCYSGVDNRYITTTTTKNLIKFENFIKYIFKKIIFFIKYLFKSLLNNKIIVIPTILYILALNHLISIILYESFKVLINIFPSYLNNDWGIYYLIYKLLILIIIYYFKFSMVHPILNFIVIINIIVLISYYRAYQKMCNLKHKNFKLFTQSKDVFIC